MEVLECTDQPLHPNILRSISKEVFSVHLNSGFAEANEVLSFLVNGVKTKPGRYPTFVSLRDQNVSSSDSSGNYSSFYYSSPPP
jgi:secreted trypsin-like serine protease